MEAGYNAFECWDSSWFDFFVDCIHNHVLEFFNIGSPSSCTCLIQHRFTRSAVLKIVEIYFINQMQHHYVVFIIRTSRFTSLEIFHVIIKIIFHHSNAALLCSFHHKDIKLHIIGYFSCHHQIIRGRTCNHVVLSSRSLEVGHVTMWMSSSPSSSAVIC